MGEYSRHDADWRSICDELQMAVARRQRDVARFQARRAEATDYFLTVLMLSDLGPAHETRTFYERRELGVQLIDRQYVDHTPLFAGRVLVELGEHFRDNDGTDRANMLYMHAYDIGREHHDADLMAAAQCARA